MQSTRQFDFAEGERKILERIDIAAEAARLGFRFTSPSANGGGWREGHAIGREDANPSAAICVELGNDALGRYRDLGGDGTSCSFWEFGVLAGEFSDWREARSHYAKIAGVRLPGSGVQRKRPSGKKGAGAARDKLLKQISKIGQDEKLFEQFVAAKPGVTVAAIRAADARTCRWKGFDGVAFMAYDSNGHECAILLCRANGQDFPAVGKLSARKTHLVGGSRDGWIILGERSALESADVVLCVEGVGDALAVYPHLSGGAVVMTNCCGASARSRLPVGLLTGKRVFVIGDSDRPGQRGAEAFARNAASVATEVWLIRLPGEVREKHGADLRDFWSGGGTTEQFQRLIRESELVTKPAADKTPGLPDGHEPVEADDDPHRLADIILSMWALSFFRSDFYRYRRRQYEKLSRDEIRSLVTCSIKDEFDRLHQFDLENFDPRDPDSDPPKRMKVGTGLVSNVLQALQSLAIVSFRSDWPRWADGRVGEFIATENGILDVGKAMVGVADCLLPHSSDWLSTVCLPYEFDPVATCPKWLAFLSRNVEDDQQRIDLLQEWFGLQLVPDTSQQKFMLMVGEGSNGKSVCCAVLVALLGCDNVSHLPLEDFGQRFQLATTLGKLANISSEIGELDKVAEGHLKSFTSGDRMSFEAKHKPLFDALPTARLTLATNTLPRFSDRSGGLWRRLLLMPWRVEIPVSERIVGMDSMEYWQDELPGILNWALTGLRRLRQQERFTESDVCDEALAEYRTSNNPTRTFLLEGYREHSSGQVPCRDVYRAYVEWCGRTGHRPLADRAFGREVVRAFRSVQRSRITFDGARAYFYIGLCEGADADQF